MRDDFTNEIRRAVAERVGFVCSNPACHAPTRGPRVDSTKSLNVGVAAHITAASPNGPRYNPSLSSEERRNAENAIWLCQNCGKLVDNDAVAFPESALRRWKEQAEAKALASIGKTKPPVDAFSRLVLNDQRLKMVMEHYRETGSPKYIIDTFDDLTIQEKAALYDKAVMLKKGRKSKHNPYLGSG